MNHKTLPGGYILFKTVNLQTQRRLALGINAAALGIAALMVAAAVFFIPFRRFISFQQPQASDALRLLLLVPAIFIYIVTHELIHGLFMRRYSGVKPKYGFSGLYAYAGSPAFFDRKSYLKIAMAPVWIWFLVLLAANLLLPDTLFWFAYILQILNISGAAGDFYITWVSRSMPADVLIRDWGYKMEFYCPVQKIPGGAG